MMRVSDEKFSEESGNFLSVRERIGCVWREGEGGAQCEGEYQ